MQVCRELDYGVRAVLMLSTAEGEIVSKKRISEQMHIPVNFLAIILPKLVRTGIINSIPGPKGGYQLSRLASEISINDVIGSVCKSFAFNRCLDISKGCELGSVCPVKPHWSIVQSMIEEYLSNVKFDQLAKDLKNK